MSNMIKIYTNQWNKDCIELKKFLKEKKKKFTEIDVSKDTKSAMEMIEKTRQSSVPVIEIDGKTFIGFDKKAIGEVLGK